MSGNARIAKDAAYVNGTALPSGYFPALDTAQMQAINAAAGGTWNPSSPIVIGGAGMAALGPWSLGDAPAIQPVSGSSARITHGDSDWVELGSGHAAASRSLRTSLGTAADTSFFTDAQGGIPRVLGAETSHGATVTPTGTVSGNFVGGARLAMPIRVHHGATLTEIDFYFTISSSHLPANLPLIRVVRIDMAGTVQPLYIGDIPSIGRYAGNGWLFASVATTAGGYYGGGTPQFSGYFPDAAYSVIDTSQYAYVAQVIDESGAGAAGGNLWFEVLAKFSSIPDMRPQ